MTTSTTKTSNQPSDDQWKRAGRTAAILVLGPNHQALPEVESHLLDVVERRRGQGKVPSAAYAFTVAKHYALKLLKKELNHDGLGALALNGLASALPVGEFASPSKQMEMKELTMGLAPLVTDLKAAILQLKEDDREFLVGYVVRHSFNAQKFALELGTTPNAVSVKFHRIQKRVFLKLTRDVTDPFAGLLSHLVESGYKTCQVVNGLLRMLFEFSAD